MMTKDDHIRYWLTIAQHDLESAEDIFKAGRYDWALFIGHLALEKVLKALWVKNNHENIPPRTHNLVKLAHGAGLTLSPEEVEYLDRVTGFNIEGRYPDQKLAFYELCTKEFSREQLDQLREYYQCILQKM